MTRGYHQLSLGERYRIYAFRKIEGLFEDFQNVRVYRKGIGLESHWNSKSGWNWRMQALRKAILR